MAAVTTVTLAIQWCFMSDKFSSIELFGDLIKVTLSSTYKCKT